MKQTVVEFIFEELENRQDSRTTIKDKGVAWFSLMRKVDIKEISCSSTVLDYKEGIQESQLISLVGGNNFVVYSVLLTNPSTVIDKANGGYLYSEENKSGVNVADVFFNGDVRGKSGFLKQSNSFINNITQNVDLYPTPKGGASNFLIGNALYFNIEIVQDATCDIYVYGIIIN
jgi:hypothetical protein